MSEISIICIFLTLQIKIQKCEVDSFSSVAALEKLLATQAHLIESIKYSMQFVDKQEKGIVKALLAKLKKEHALSRGDPEHYLGNPINSYALIMRLFRDLQLVEKILNKTNTYRRSSSLVYPSKTDVDGANAGLILMQIMYGMDIQKLADGKMIGRFSKNKQRFEEFVSPLTANDCFDLANLYFIEEDRTAHVTWLEEAYKRYNTDHVLCHFTEDALLKKITQSYGFMEDWKNTIYWLEKYLAVNKNDQQARVIYKQVKHQYKENLDIKPKPRISLDKKFGIDATVMRLCRYESGPIARKMNLSCYYARGPHPFLQLAPIKAEILHRDPDITMFYDVISDAEIEAFKAHAKPELTRSQVLEDNIRKVSLSWTSQTMKASYELTEVIRVLKRIHQFTGLRWGQSTFDKMIVGNYGLAGYYTPHCDFFVNKHPQRIATVLLYLSNVEQGGATVFLDANLTVFPVKNAALFWYNLDPWGNPDSRTVHAACPVVRGSKWVATKWIELMDQDLSRLCPVHPQPPKSYPKNACS